MKLSDVAGDYPPMPENAVCEFCKEKAIFQYNPLIFIAEEDGTGALAMFPDHKIIYTCEKHYHLSRRNIIQKYITPEQFKNLAPFFCDKGIKKYWKQGRRLARLAQNMLEGMDKPNMVLPIEKLRPDIWMAFHLVSKCKQQC